MREERERLLIANPEFARDRLKRIAYEKLLPQEFIENYADYFTILFDGRPTLLSPDWYDDDWYLMENKKFYDRMVEQGLWKKDYKNFDKVPTRDEFKLYQTYLALPHGRPRYDYRAAHPELDKWLVHAGKVTRSVPESERRRAAGRWAVWAEEFADYLRDVEETYEQRRKKSIADLDALRRRLDELTKK